MRPFSDRLLDDISNSLTVRVPKTLRAVGQENAEIIAGCAVAAILKRLRDNGKTDQEIAALLAVRAEGADQ